MKYIQCLMEVIIKILGYDDPFIIKDDSGYKTLSGQYFMNQEWAKNRYKMLDNLSNLSPMTEGIENLSDYIDLYMKADSDYKRAKEERYMRKHLLWEKLNKIYKSVYNTSLETYKEKEK